MIVYILIIYDWYDPDDVSIKYYNSSEELEENLRKDFDLKECTCPDTYPDTEIDSGIVTIEDNGQCKLCKGYSEVDDFLSYGGGESGDRCIGRIEEYDTTTKLLAG
jgi:hypothetical protein